MTKYLILHNENRESTYCIKHQSLTEYRCRQLLSNDVKKLSKMLGKQPCPFILTVNENGIMFCNLIKLCNIQALSFEESDNNLSMTLLIKSSLEFLLYVCLKIH